MKRVKLSIILTVDPDVYPVAVDGEWLDQFRDELWDLFHDVDGVKVRDIYAEEKKVLTK